MIKFEDLKADPIGELKKCLEFLGLKHMLENQKILNCLNNDLEGSFHRKVKQDMTEMKSYFDQAFVKTTEAMAALVIEEFEQVSILSKLTSRKIDL